VHLGDIPHARHQVIVEVRLLDGAVLEGDPLAEGKPQAIDDRALGLGHDVVRLDGDARIDGAPEVVDADHAPRTVDRDLGHAGHHRVRVVDEREAQAPAGARASVVRHLDHRPDDGLPARRVLEELQSELHGIDASPVGDLVEEGLGRELVGHEADPAQRRRADPGVLPQLLGQAVRDVVRPDLRSQDGDEILLPEDPLEARDP
jgi:hypothetical protein